MKRSPSGGRFFLPERKGDAVELYYKVEDKPPFSRSLLLAIQHLLAALGAIVAVPLAMANALELSTADTVILVNAAMLVSGVVTALQCKAVGPVGIRLPCMMGSSFTFVAFAIAVGNTYGLSGVMGSMLVGALVPIIGSFFMPQLKRLFPPVVAGTVVMLVGFVLMPVTLNWIADYASLGAGAEPVDALWVAGMVMVALIALSQWGEGFISAVSVVISILAGYFLCWLYGWVDFSAVISSPVTAIPTPFHFGLSFPILGIIGMSIAYLVTTMESTADFIALSNTSGTKLTGRKLSRGVLAVGLGGALAPVLSGTPVTTFSQNIGAVAVTGVASRHVVAIAGGLLILSGLIPVFAALLVSIPKPVLGAASLVMVAMIVWSGVKMLVGVEQNRRNGMIVSIGLSVGVALTLRPDLLVGLPIIVRDALSSGVTTGAVVALLLNQVLPGKPGRQKNR